ncbi:transposable element P transposase [Trichonephila clavipes]|nr:transposable element P transposase [Trichonephila clavipes]
MKANFIASRYECPKRRKDMRLQERKRTVDGYKGRYRNQSKDNPHDVVRSWLDCWKNLKQNKREGCLSEETFFALRHTVNTIPELIKYLLTEQNFKYVLTGKFQTDSLEARFGQYRQMSGANYHITAGNFASCEKKLRIKSVLTLHSDKYGTISLKKLISNHSGEIFHVKVDITDFNEILNIRNKSDDISIEEYQALMYIAGYCGHNIKFECSDCKHTFVLDKQINFDSENIEGTKYLRLLDRGGLKMPTDIVMKVISTLYFIFSLLISKTFESKFLLKLIANYLALQA